MDLCQLIQGLKDGTIKREVRKASDKVYQREAQGYNAPVDSGAEYCRGILSHGISRICDSDDADSRSLIQKRIGDLTKASS